MKYTENDWVKVNAGTGKVLGYFTDAQKTKNEKAMKVGEAIHRIKYAKELGIKISESIELENIVSYPDEISVVQLATNQMPEDFRVAVTGMLNDRLRNAIADARGEMSESTNGVADKKTGPTGENKDRNSIINQDDKTDSPVKGSVAAGTAPSATNPRAKGHEQTDEKKVGSLTAKKLGKSEGNMREGCQLDEGSAVQSPELKKITDDFSKFAMSGASPKDVQVEGEKALKKIKEYSVRNKGK